MIRRLRKINQYFLTHPIGSRRYLKVVIRFISWQIYSLFVKKEIKVKWIEGASFYLTKSMHGLTGNFYLGLLDFNEMSFLLHFLDKKDHFIDIGANVGAYSVLASKVKGAISHSFEPVPVTFQLLKRNIELNEISNIVNLHNKGVAETPGVLHFTKSQDTVNHVVEEGEDSIAIEVMRMDDLINIDRITLMKIDIEGYELFALKGAENLLKNEFLKAIIIELNGSGQLYGISDADIDDLLVKNGFSPYDYNPFTRQIMKLESYNNSNNTIYLRDTTTIQKRLDSAHAYKVYGISI